MKWRQYEFFVDSLALYRSGDCDCGGFVFAGPQQEKTGRRVEHFSETSVSENIPLKNAGFAALVIQRIARGEKLQGL